MGTGGVKVGGEGGEGTVPCGGSNRETHKRLFEHVSKEKIFSHTMWH
jgi:hypothetical protein